MSAGRIAAIAAAGLIGLATAWWRHDGLAPAALAEAHVVALDQLMADAPAKTLAAYGLFADAGAREPSAGVTPYALNTPLFSDYAEKFRYVYLPPSEQAAYTDEGVLDFPEGAVLIKTFAYPADFRHPDDNLRFIETRLLIRRAEGWKALTYVWNADQTEATLKRTGTRIEVAFIDAQGASQRIDYAVPNVNQCKECHSIDGVLNPIGPKARNLNGDMDYDGVMENQIAHWSRTGMLSGAPAPEVIPATARWSDLSTPLDKRARAYLDGNCAHCHNPKGMANTSGLFLNWEEDRPAHLGVNKNPTAAGRGSGDLLVDVSPGHPDKSILLYRMESIEPGVMMPELGRSTIHRDGVELIRAYIAQMDQGK